MLSWVESKLSAYTVQGIFSCGELVFHVHLPATGRARDQVILAAPERWVAARRIAKMLPQFEVHTHGRLAPVASWLGAMVRLFAPQIAAMVRERDAVLALHGARLGREAAFEDRTLDVVTECPAGLAAHVRQLGL